MRENEMKCDSLGLDKYDSNVHSCCGPGNMHFISVRQVSLPIDFPFLPCDALRCTVFGIVILTVRLSVRLSHSWTVSTWFDLRL